MNVNPSMAVRFRRNCDEKLFRGGCKDEQSDDRELRIKIKGGIGEESGKLCAGRPC